MNAKWNTWSRRVLWGVGTAGGVFVLWVFLRVETGSAPDVVLFLGRFHPLLVHFPIGLLLLAALLEVLARASERFARVRPAIPVVLVLGAAAALFAVGAGWMLSLSGGYDAVLVAWHMWLGIGVAAGAVAACLLHGCAHRKVRASAFFERAYLAVLAGTVGLLVVTGHLGGTLTRGPGYLTAYLPAPLKRLTGLGGEAPGASDIPMPVDSVIVYRHLVQPVFQEWCVSCHGPSKTKGELRLDSPEQIMEGGEHGAILVAGKPAQSELVRRVTLPLYHEDRMPPEEKEPLPIEQVALLRWWIRTGATFDKKVAEVEEETIPFAVQTVLTRLSRPYEKPRGGLYALEVAPPDTGAMKALQRAGIEVRYIAQDTPFLQVDLSGETLDLKTMKRLLPLAVQIAWLDLSGARVTEQALSFIGRMEHLTRLHLQHSTAGNAALAHLKSLKHLEYLNLYDTKVSDAGLRHLAGLADLKTLYLWHTDVSVEGVRRLQRRLPELSVTIRSTPAPADSTLTS